jgi:hypothetical protein
LDMQVCGNSSTSYEGFGREGVPETENNRIAQVRATTLRFEVEIGKAPPLSDDELSEHICKEAYITPLFSTVLY